ncbi:MAG: PleD family two-component system response regulator, partial [Bosea sp. (in: a-proteobacteria)]
MTARVLVVDDLAPNVKLLEAKLSAEYFDVVTATNGPDALRICASGAADIVLLDVMMPGMDGFEVCRRLKSSAQTAHIPVVMVTALDQPSDRLRGLDAGADDFLTKPLDDTALFARVRSLARLKAMTDELRNRAMASRNLGIADTISVAASDLGENATILIVDDRPSSSERMKGALEKVHQVTVEADPHKALVGAADGSYELVIVSLDLQGFDGLRLCTQLRSLDRTRNSTVLMVGEAEDRMRILRGLELGVHDFLVRPVDRNELLARVRTQVKRKRYADRLRDGVQTTIEMAVTDQLTGLHNRRYLETHFNGLFDESAMRARDLAVLMLDIDKFKLVNDTYGHDAGDEVLKEFARRVKDATRVVDVVARLGGEEIVVVLPETGLQAAAAVAERIRAHVQGKGFAIHGGTNQIPVTVSIGVASRKAG